MTALPEPGSRFAGKYVIERELGAGAVGVVYSATHEDLRQRVAIKLLREAAAPIASERMIREARAAIALHSEHVVRVMDVGRAQGRVFLVMEHLEGADLASVLRARGPLPVAEAVDCVLQACAGVAEAHARGVVHRDLKPSNLFLTRRADGSPLVKVLDFGISKTSEGEDVEGSLTGPSELLGSPMYMSPEQVRGAKAVDHRTDIWSLGVILFRLLSGQPPFARGAKSVSAVLASVVGDPPAPLRELAPGVPRELEAVVSRCLEKSPDARFSTIGELAAQLAPFGTEDGRAAVVRLVRNRIEPPPRTGRRPWPLVVGAALLLLAVPALAWLGIRHGKAEASDELLPPTAPGSATAAPSTEPYLVDTGTVASVAAGASASPVPSASSGWRPGVSPLRPRHPVAHPRQPAASSVVRSAATDDRY